MIFEGSSFETLNVVVHWVQVLYACSYSFLDRFEIEVEPMFASLALYDLKEKKKVNMLYIYFSK